jgi:hypothetical protein
MTSTKLIWPPRSIRFPLQIIRNGTESSPQSAVWTSHYVYKAPSRSFSFTSQRFQHQREPFRSRLRTALRNTKIEWYPIPVGLGIGFLGFVQIYRIREREKARQEDIHDHEDTYGSDPGEGGDGRPRKRKRIRPSGPWYLNQSCGRV